MTQDIRMKTRLILRKDGYWLQGIGVLSRRVMWTPSAWEAWGTRDRIAAEKVSEIMGGCEMWLFNPVAGQLKRLGT